MGAKSKIAMTAEAAPISVRILPGAQTWIIEVDPHRRRSAMTDPDDLAVVAAMLRRGAEVIDGLNAEGFSVLLGIDVLIENGDGCLPQLILTVE